MTGDRDDVSDSWWLPVALRGMLYSTSARSAARFRIVSCSTPTARSTYSVPCFKSHSAFLVSRQFCYLMSYELKAHTSPLTSKRVKLSVIFLASSMTPWLCSLVRDTQWTGRQQKTSTQNAKWSIRVTHGLSKYPVVGWDVIGNNIYILFYI